MATTISTAKTFIQSPLPSANAAARVAAERDGDHRR